MYVCTLFKASFLGWPLYAECKYRGMYKYCTYVGYTRICNFIYLHICGGVGSARR